jgi:hypothetical protein
MAWKFVEDGHALMLLGKIPYNSGLYCIIPMTVQKKIPKEHATNI